MPSHNSRRYNPKTIVVYPPTNKEINVRKVIGHRFGSLVGGCLYLGNPLYPKREVIAAYANPRSMVRADFFTMTRFHLNPDTLSRDQVNPCIDSGKVDYNSAN